jgi:hypothetical protein
MAPRHKMLGGNEGLKKNSPTDRLGTDVESGGEWRRRKRMTAGSSRSIFAIHPTTSLPLLVLIDMFAVSLVVPLLFQYYKAAGVTSADQRELLSSLFSTSQIAGGLLMGILTDAKLVQRKMILFISFGGSALSYALIVYGGLSALILSRVLVGFVKQTMTVSTAMLTRCTTKETRAAHMGRLTAASTVAWIVGPSVGALLFKYIDPKAPALLACALFVLNTLLASLFLGGSDEEIELRALGGKSIIEDSYVREHEDASVCKKNGKGVSIVSNLLSCFTSQALGSVVVAQLIYTWVTKTTNYSQLGSFYEDMYGLEPHHRGYISSYQQFLQFAVQSLLVTTLLNWSGGERRTICFFTALLSLAVLLECLRSLTLFLVVLCPLISLCFAMTNLSLQTLLTQVAPSHSIFSVLAALDVLQNAVSVSVPFYRTLLFKWLAPAGSAAMKGDPDPVSWIYSAFVHWLLAAVATSYLLLSSSDNVWTEEHSRKEKGR